MIQAEIARIVSQVLGPELRREINTLKLDGQEYLFAGITVGDQPDAVTLHSIGVSFLPYHIFNRRSFVAAFTNLGHRQVDDWRTPELGCRIPDHASHSLDSYSGFYFILDQSGPARAGSSVH